MRLDEYRESSSIATLSRSDEGVLTVRLHSKEGALWWSGRPHRELPNLFSSIAADRANRVVVLTGTGSTFIGMPEIDENAGLARGSATPANWDRIIFEGNRLVNQLLDIEVPMIAAVNGPVELHSELALLCDIVLCTDDSTFSDRGHFPMDTVPGDSMQVLWMELLGWNRGRYFLLTGQRLSADEAHALGVVSEVLPRDRLMERAYELADNLATRNPILLRNTRHVLTRAIKRAMANDLHTGLALEAIASLSGKEWFAPPES